MRQMVSNSWNGVEKIQLMGKRGFLQFQGLIFFFFFFCEVECKEFMNNSHLERASVRACSLYLEHHENVKFKMDIREYIWKGRENFTVKFH